MLESEYICANSSESSHRRTRSASLYQTPFGGKIPEGTESKHQLRRSSSVASIHVSKTKVAVEENKISNCTLSKKGNTDSSPYIFSTGNLSLFSFPVEFQEPLSSRINENSDVENGLSSGADTAHSSPDNGHFVSSSLISENRILTFQRQHSERVQEQKLGKYSHLNSLRTI